MVQLTVRNVDDEVVRALKQRAARHGRSAEAEHRDILRKSLLEQDEGFASARTLCGSAFAPRSTVPRSSAPTGTATARHDGVRG